MAYQDPTESAVIQRVKAEFLEMPGLKLTPAQAERLWNLSRSTCEGVLGALVDRRFLLKTGDGAFVRADAGVH
jgi:hypothetical protein